MLMHLSLPRDLPAGCSSGCSSGQTLGCSAGAGLGILCHGKQRHSGAGLGSAQATWETVTAQAAGSGQSSVRQQRLGRCPLCLKGTSLAGLWVSACGEGGFSRRRDGVWTVSISPIPDLLIFAKTAAFVSWESRVP